MPAGRTEQEHLRPPPRARQHPTPHLPGGSPNSPNSPNSPRSGRRVGSSLRAEQRAWYERREALHIERAKLRGACLVELAAEMMGGDAASASIAESLVQQLMWNGHDSFAAAGRELDEMTPGTLATVRALVAWYATADARLGEYPQ
jgi:hypothetical protein